MHKNPFSTPSISSYTISPTLRRCGPKVGDSALWASFSPRLRPAGASYGISIGWLRMRSPLFGGRASSRVGVPHRRWPCTQAATGQPLPDSSAHDPPAHPSEQRRLRLRVQKYTGPLAWPSRAAFLRQKSVSLPRVGQTLDCGSWPEEFFFCPQAVRPVCVAGLLRV
jgi:hypothetical protein